MVVFRPIALQGLLMLVHAARIEPACEGDEGEQPTEGKEPGEGEPAIGRDGGELRDANGLTQFCVNVGLGHAARDDPAVAVGLARYTDRSDTTFGVQRNKRGGSSGGGLFDGKDEEPWALALEVAANGVHTRSIGA